MSNDPILSNEPIPSMDPGSFLLLAGWDPPILATVTAIGTDQIETVQYDDSRLKCHNTWGKCSLGDFVCIGTHNQRKVFGNISRFNLQELSRVLQECKDKMLEKEVARLDQEKREPEASLAYEKRKQEAHMAQERLEQEARMAQEKRNQKVSFAQGKPSRISVLLNDALNLPFQRSTLISPGKPKEEDTKLAEKWAEGKPTMQAMMLSARMAEKAAIKYFLDRGEKTEDIAVQQLSETGSRVCDWKSYDIRVGTACIDVKNARRSQHNPCAFVRHCVPRFKDARDGSSVVIAGALSNYLRFNEIISGKSQVRFLGTTSADKISQLRKMLTLSRLQLPDTSLNEPKFLPSWIFDYSAADYQARDKAIDELSTIINDPSMESEINMPEFLPALVVVGATNALALILPEKSWKLDFVTCLNGRLKQYCSLSVIFLTILEHFLTMLADDAPSDYSPNAYRDFIFYSDRWKSPLFLCDPEQAICSLIESLATLWHYRDDSILNLKIFRLHQLNILSGKRDECSPWQTVLAYCGGWKTESGGPRPCGMTPLVYGKCRSCSCGKLICPKCDFCSKSCAEHEHRQNLRSPQPDSRLG